MKTYGTVEQAVAAVLKALARTKPVPSNYCPKCTNDWWPTRRAGALPALVASLRAQLHTSGYQSARSFEVGEVQRLLYSNQVEGGVCLVVWFEQHNTRFHICPSEATCYACGPEDWSV